MFISKGVENMENDSKLTSTLYFNSEPKLYSLSSSVVDGLEDIDRKLTHHLKESSRNSRFTEWKKSRKLRPCKKPRKSR